MKSNLIVCGICIAAILSLAACGPKEDPSGSQQPPAINPSSSESASVEPESSATEGSPAETAVPEAEPLDSIYADLSDTQFALLTEMMAKSFYSFTLDDPDYNVLTEYPAVMDCLTAIYMYAYSNYFEIDPDYKAVFATKYEVISNIPNYEQLQENFLVEHYRDNIGNKWIYTINSYSLDPNDVFDDNGTLYIDAEGYLNKDVTVYWEEDEGLEATGKITDIAYNIEVDGVIFAYALNVDFFDDPSASGWRDGENFLTFNKELTGKPAYYVSALDKNRNIKKEIIDYSGSIQWKPLDISNAKSGTEVYLGATGTKAFMFTVIDVNPAEDSMTVKYPSGSVETKCYSAITNQKNLYVK